jgi:hypothetical protein
MRVCKGWFLYLIRFHIISYIEVESLSFAFYLKKFCNKYFISIFDIYDFHKLLIFFAIVSSHPHVCHSCGLRKFLPNFIMYSLCGTKNCPAVHHREYMGFRKGQFFVLFKHLNNVDQIQHTTGQNFFENLNSDIEPIWFYVKELERTIKKIHELEL